MRICVLTTSYPAYKEHLQSPFVHELAKHLTKEKVKVDVVCPFYKESKGKKERIDGVNVLRFKYFFPVGLQKLTKAGGIPSNLKKYFLAKIQMPLFLLSMFFRARKPVINCNVIHAQWLLSGLIGVFLKKIYKKPLVLTTRGAALNLALKNKLMKKIALFVLKNCDYITPNNQAHFNVISSLGIKRDKILTIYNGIDIQKFKPRNKKEARKRLNISLDKKIILFVGWLIERKGVKYLIDAVPTVLKKYPNSLFIVIGEGELKDKLVNQTRRLKVMDFVKFIGPKSLDEVSFWMNAADLFVLPSLSEGRPNVVGEAMASGLPTVATKVNGTPEFIDDMKNGLLISPKNSKEIEKSIILLLKNNKLRKEISSNSRRSIMEKKLTWANCAKNYITIYNKKYFT